MGKRQKKKMIQVPIPPKEKEEAAPKAPARSTTTTEAYSATEPSVFLDESQLGGDDPVCLSCHLHAQTVTRTLALLDLPPSTVHVVLPTWHSILHQLRCTTEDIAKCCGGQSKRYSSSRSSSVTSVDRSGVFWENLKQHVDEAQKKQPPSTTDCSE